MSDTEMHIGKLIPTELTQANLDDLFNLSEEYKKGYEYNDWFYDLEKYYVYKDIVYEIQDTKHYDSDYLVVGNKTENGEIEYVSQFYNGGCGFLETLDEVMEKANA